MMGTAAAQSSTAQAGRPDAPVSSRAEALAREQAERSRTLKPYQPTSFEKAVNVAQDFVLTPPVVYPWFGSIYPGGLFALGAGTRKPYGDTGMFDAHAGWSFRNYTGAEATLHLPELAKRHLQFDVRGSYINAPSVHFHGLGMDSQESATNFKYQPTMVGGTATVVPVDWFKVGGGIDYLDITTSGAKKGTSIEQVFNPVTAPGLDTDPTYVRTNAMAAIDYRRSPGWTDRGGYYHVEWYDYRQRDNGPYSFRRTDAELQQFIPLMRSNWVLAFRGLVSTTDTDQLDRVPYYLMPDLGGSSTLRGYSSWRFRDRHRLLLTGEYRWLAGQFVDMALFVDAGKVVSRRSELDFKDLEPTYGLGFRVHTPNATMLRIEVAKTREGVGIIFTAGPNF